MYFIYYKYELLLQPLGDRLREGTTTTACWPKIGMRGRGHPLRATVSARPLLYTRRTMSAGPRGEIASSR